MGTEQKYRFEGSLGLHTRQEYVRSPFLVLVLNYSCSASLTADDRSGQVLLAGTEDSYFFF